MIFGDVDAKIREKIRAQGFPQLFLPVQKIRKIPCQAHDARRHPVTIRNRAVGDGIPAIAPAHFVAQYENAAVGKIPTQHLICEIAEASSRIRMYPAAVDERFREVVDTYIREREAPFRTEEFAGASGGVHLPQKKAPLFLDELQAFVIGRQHAVSSAYGGNVGAEDQQDRLL